MIRPARVFRFGPWHPVPAVTAILAILTDCRARRRPTRQTARPTARARYVESLRDESDAAQGGPSALSTPPAVVAPVSRPLVRAPLISRTADTAQPEGWLLQHDGTLLLRDPADRAAQSNRPYYIDLRDARRPSSSWTHPLDLPPSPQSPAPSSSPSSRRSASPRSRIALPRAPIPRALSTSTSSVLSPHARRYSSPAQTQAFALGASSRHSSALTFAADNFLRQPSPPSPAVMRRQSSNDPPGMTIAQLARQRTDGASPPVGQPSSAPIGGFVIPSAERNDHPVLPDFAPSGARMPSPRQFNQSPDPLPSSAPVGSFAVPPFDRADELGMSAPSRRRR